MKYPSTRNKHRLRYLTQAEAYMLLDELEKSSRTIYEIAYISLYAGMRADEIFSLKWQDIDRQKPSLPQMALPSETGEFLGTMSIGSGESIGASLRIFR